MALSTQQKAKLKRQKVAHNLRQFAQMRFNFSDRVNILSEGDSWFAYPPNWFIAGKPSNLIDHLSSWCHDNANFFSMASNGDEAVDMISGKQKHAIVKILQWHTKAQNRKPIDLLLFSGGGNDVVGENDFERFLVSDCRSKTTVEECIRTDRLKRKVKQIGLAYHELVDIRDHYSPETIIITHTYDYPYPSLTGGVFLGGLIETKGWMKRFMDEAMIADNLQAGVIQFFMDALANETLQVQSTRDKFTVVDTRKTLIDERKWLNEIHPTSEGFKEISKLIYTEMQQAFPQL